MIALLRVGVLVIFLSRHLYFYGEESIKGPPRVGYRNVPIVAKRTERLLVHFQAHLTYFGLVSILF